MNCNKIRPHLSAYADGELSGNIREQVGKHLQSCPACAGILEEYGRISRVIRDAPAGQLSADFENSVIRRLRGRPLKKTVPLFRLALVSALLAAAFLLGLSWVKNRVFVPSGLVITDDEINQCEDEALDIFYGGRRISENKPRQLWREREEQYRVF